MGRLHVFTVPTEKLADRFSLNSTVLGVGRYGAVRECRDLATGEVLACKTVKKVPWKIEAQREDIQEETDIMMRLAGEDSVVQLRGVFEEEKEVHLVMDLCHGGELFEEIIRRERFTEEAAAPVFAAIVMAVVSCHSRGIVHRDLKPENILLTRHLTDGRKDDYSDKSEPLVKLADFGFATRIPPGRTLQGLVGSPFYIAPEVLDREYDEKSDIWSLGVILYILLSGEPPFWGEDDKATFQAVRKGELDLTSPPWNSVSMEAKSLIKSLLTRQPACRPSAQKILAHPWLLLNCGAKTHVPEAPVCSSALSVPVA